MSTLPSAPCFCSYNGVVFPVETETTEMKIAPVYDAASRAVKYVLYSITLRATQAMLAALGPILPAYLASRALEAQASPSMA